MEGDIYERNLSGKEYRKSPQKKTNHTGAARIRIECVTTGCIKMGDRGFPK